MTDTEAYDNIYRDFKNREITLIGTQMLAKGSFPQRDHVGSFGRCNTEFTLYNASENLSAHNPGEWKGLAGDKIARSRSDLQPEISNQGGKNNDYELLHQE